MGEGRGGYPGVGYERVAYQVYYDSFSLQNHNELWEGFVSVTDEDRGAFQGDGEDWGDVESTRKRSKRDNRQAGQQLMRRPTRKRSKRDNR